MVLAEVRSAHGADPESSLSRAEVVSPECDVEGSAWSRRRVLLHEAYVWRTVINRQGTVYQVRAIGMVISKRVRARPRHGGVVSRQCNIECMEIGRGDCRWHGDHRRNAAGYCNAASVDQTRVAARSTVTSQYRGRCLLIVVVVNVGAALRLRRGCIRGITRCSSADSVAVGARLPCSRNQGS